ncbi:MAG: SHOCT domain-containing protein [Gammaproteobacteria bacterium]|nr:SHOCT domain-containing protein [Gammaproteobacteria bacterium]
MYEWHGYGGGMMWIFWILIIVALIWFVAFATRRGGLSSGNEKSALEVLKERYARGEIDRDEFEQKQKDLKS